MMTKLEYEKLIKRFCEAVLISNKYDMATVKTMSKKQLRAQAALHSTGEAMAAWANNLSTFELPDEFYSQIQGQEGGDPSGPALGEVERKEWAKREIEKHKASMKQLGDQLDADRKQSKQG